MANPPKLDAGRDTSDKFLSAVTGVSDARCPDAQQSLVAKLQESERAYREKQKEKAGQAQKERKERAGKAKGSAAISGGGARKSQREKATLLRSHRTSLLSKSPKPSVTRLGCVVLLIVSRSHMLSRQGSIHDGIQCHGCGKRDFAGVRWKCSFCPTTTL